MKLTTRPLQHEDYDTILKGWWKDWGWDAPNRDFQTKTTESLEKTLYFYL